MDDLTSTQGIVALAAAGGALIALIWAGVLGLKLRRLRAAQRTVLGAGRRAGPRRPRRRACRRRSSSCATGSRRPPRGSTSASARAERRIDGCVAYTALIRYDAYGEMSGHQSSTMALLDSSRTGVVVSSILHRDQARMYVKQLNDGVPELELSPEEQEAVETAMRGTPAGA